MRWLWRVFAPLILFVFVGAQRAAPLRADDASAQVTEIPKATSEATPAWCVSVWYPSASAPGGLDSIQKNDDLISVVNPFWYSSNADGTVEKSAADTENADELAAWRADKLTIIPTIYGNTWQMLSDPTTLASHVDQIISLVNIMNYDGFDIDYESFPLATRDEFSTFIEMLSTKLHADHKLLTVAVHPKTDDAGTWYGAAAQDWTRIAPAVDVFTIMTYDYTDRNQPPGPISPPDWVQDVLTYAASVTDLHKVHMGLPFYGYSWTRDNPPATTTDWVSVNRLIQTFKPTVERDPTEMEAQIELKVHGLPKQTIYVEDSTAIQYKMKQILTAFPDLGGVGIWGIGGEDPADWGVLRAARQANCTLKS